MPRESNPVQFYKAGSYSPQESVGYLMKRANEEIYVLVPEKH